MEKRDIKIQLPDGLHMRIAAKLVQKSREIKSKVMIFKENEAAELGSIIQLMMLGAEKGTEIKIVVEGEDEKSAADGITDILIDGAGI